MNTGNVVILLNYQYSLYVLLAQRRKSVKFEEILYSDCEINFCWTKYVSLKEVEETIIVKFGGVANLELIHSNFLTLELLKEEREIYFKKCLFQNNSVSSK